MSRISPIINSDMPMKTNFQLVLVLTVAGSLSCQHLTTNSRQPSAAEEFQPLFAARRLTDPGLFTKGIEGPAVDLKGNLYVPNFHHDGSIGIVEPGKPPRVWLDLPPGGVSASIRFDAQGIMYVADYKKHRIYQIDPETKYLSIYFEDATLNQPNDFVIASDNSIYLSDPTWNRNKKGHILKIGPNGKVTPLLSDLRTPNGIDLSPDEKTLYFTESAEGVLYAYDIQGDSLVNKRELGRFEAETLDGLRTDVEGTIYVARITKGTIDRFSPEGRLLNRIPLLGKTVSNLAFGGPDGRTVYATLVENGNIESFRVDRPGREWQMQWNALLAGKRQTK